MDDVLTALRSGEPALWLRKPGPRPDNRDPLRRGELAEVEARLERFRPVLAALFRDDHWDGRIVSALTNYPQHGLLVKGDHALPMTGSVKARGGVYELLCHVEAQALAGGLITATGDRKALLGADARAWLAQAPVAVASTGNLGYSIGLVASAFGVPATVHMSHDAKDWKKARLRELGVAVVEHQCDYTETVAHARDQAAATGAYFVDDEHSRPLFVGYAAAGRELAGQLAVRGIAPSAAHPLTVYLPCGVGGAPGGITAGLRAIYGEALRTIFVEPVASACMFVAMATGGRLSNVYEAGLDNRTIADGLAVASTSQLVLDAAGADIDGVVAVTDSQMRDWVGRAWREAGLRLEPSAASALAARAWLTIEHPAIAATSCAEVAWATGGSRLPEDEFDALTRSACA